MADYKEGQTATNGKGQRVIYKGGAWHRLDAPGSPVAGAAAAIDPDARKKLNTLDDQATEATEIQKQYQQAQGAIKRLKPGPWRARFLDAALPEEGGGVLDTLGSVLLGAPAKMLGMISPQNVDDFQRLKGLQSQRVLSEQLAQKGPQTDTDAARMQMTEISPYKSIQANNEVVASGMQKTDRIKARAPFYTQWSNRYGLNRLNENGESVGQAWNKHLQAAQPRRTGGGPVIKRIK